MQNSKAYPIFSGIQGYKKFMKMLYSLRKFREDEIAQERMRIIKFYEEYGEKATKEAFGADRKVINRWQKRLKENGGTLSSLVPSSTRPHRVRHSTVSQEIINFIKDMREKYPRIGKEKLKPLLDKYCEEKGLKPISESTIGAIIKRHNFFYQKADRIYHDPNSKWAQNRIKRTTRLKIKHLTGWKFLSLIFAFFYLISYSAISFASTITNSALVSYKINNLQEQVSTNSTSTTVNVSPVAAIIAPKNNSIVPQKFTVFGTASANAQIEIKKDGLSQYSLTSDSNGYYSQEVSFTTIGSHTIMVKANGSEGESITVNAVSGLPLDYPIIESPTDGARITNRRPQVNGTAAKNSPITIYAKASPVKIVGIGSSDSNGDFTINLNQDLSSGTTQLFVMDTTYNLTSEVHEVTYVDPEGVVVDSVSNNPIKGAQVTLYNATTNQPCTRGAEIPLTDTNPYTTGADGRYNFNAVDGNYYLRVSAAGYTFPSTLSSFPRAIAAGSKGQQFTITGISLTINLPVDAQNSLLKIEKDANKKEVVVGDIITYTVTIKNETASDITNVYLEDKIPPGFKYINGKVILDNAVISDPTGNRPLTFNIGTIAANTTRTLKYQLVVGSGVTFGNYENSCVAKYADGTKISNTATETVKVVPDPLFDLGTVIGKVFNDVNENGIQDNGEETIPYVRIVTEEGTIITTDKEGRWHLPGVIPGRHLFRIDESTLPEGSYLTTEKVVIVDITRGLLSKVNFGVKVPLDKLKELKEAKGLGLQIIQEKSPPRMRLNAGMYPERLKIEDNALVDRPIFKIFTNYHPFIKKWRLEIFEKDTNKLFKKLEHEALDYENTFIWDGLSDDAELVKVGKTYYYILTVWDDEGKSDVTKAREFDVKELNKKEEFKESVIGLQEKENEFKHWNDLESQLNNLDKQMIVIKGDTVKIKVQGQKEKTKLRLIVDNKILPPVSSDEEINVEIILPEGIHELKLLQETPEGSPESIYEKQIKVGDDYLFFVALADIKTGYTFNKGNIEPVQHDDKFKEGFWKEGKLAYYLKGKIKGKYLITSSLDTDRERKELFKVVDPKKYYPVYGDASSINYDATDTQGLLYLLIEWDKSKAIWGNYYTGLNDVEYAKFNRALYGGKIYYESVSNTKFGQPNTKLILFDAKIKQLASHNEFVGTGGSLYYLKHRNIIEGTDSVRIEVRDKISGLVLATLEQKNGVDYHLDYSQGRILFWRPVSSITESSSIISTHLLDGNPVYVVVEYEYEPKDEYYKGTSGLRVSQSMTDYLQLGATYVKEEKPKENYELKGIDTTLYITKDTFIKGEYAESVSEQAGNFISTDGGLSFTEIAAGKDTSGRAYGLRGQTKLWDKLYLDSYYGYVGKDFSSPGSVSQQGTEKYGFRANWDITSNTIFNLRHDTQRLVDSGNSQTQAQVGAQETRTTIAQITHTKEKLTLTGEYRHQDVEAQLSGIQTQTNQDTDIIAAKANYKVGEKLETSLEHQETVKGDTNRQTTMGIIYNIEKRLKIKLAQTFGTKGTATTLGAHAQSSDGKTGVFIERTHENLDQSNNTSTSMGVKSQLDEKREVFGTYTVSDSLEGRKQIASFGGAQKLNDRMKLSASRDFTTTKNSSASTNVLGLSGDINDRLSANIAFEKGVANNLDGSQTTRNAGSGSLRYLEKDKLKASSKLELRYDNGNENKQQYLIYNAIEYSLHKIVTLFANLNLSKARNTTTNTTEAKFKEITLGSAFRPIEWDRLNLITKYTYFENEQPQGQDNFTNITAEKASVFALEGVYDLTNKLQLVEKIAFKWGEEKVTGFDFTKSQTWLLINRLNYKLDKYWGLSGEYRILEQHQANDRNQGFLLEVSRNIGDFIQVGVGYNFTKFSDDLVHGNNYSAYGPYFRVTAKFSDQTQKEVRRSNKKRQ